MFQKYDKEFKMQTVQMILEEGKSVLQVAKDLGMSSKTLYAWVRQFKEEKEHAFRGSGNLKPEDRALRDLQKRVRDLEEENAILKKATRIFANDRD